MQIEQTLMFQIIGEQYAELLLLRQQLKNSQQATLAALNEVIELKKEIVRLEVPEGTKS